MPATLPIQLQDVLTTLSAVGKWLIGSDGQLYEAFDKTYRGSFFTGFLTMGSLLLSMNTFVLGTVKGAYDREERKQTFNALKMLDKNMSYFGPLKRLSDVVYVAMCAAFVTSFAQLVIGVVKSNITAIICMVMALGTFVVLAVALYDLWKTLDEFKADLKEPELPAATESLIKPAVMSDEPYFPSDGDIASRHD